MAYVLDEENGLQILDVSNPSSPTKIGEFTTGSLTKTVHVQGNYAYIANYENGLRILDIRNPEMPTEVGYFYTETQAFDVWASDSFAYIADGYSGLRIIDIRTPSAPVEVGFFSPEGGAISVLGSNDYVYITTGNNSLYILQNDLVVGISDRRQVLPRGFTLEQNTPNPFNPATTIQYTLATGGEVELRIFNTLGQPIRTLVQGRQPAGHYQVRWDGRDDSGAPVASGIYFYVLRHGDGWQTRKMVLLR